MHTHRRAVLALALLASLTYSPPAHADAQEAAPAAPQPSDTAPSGAEAAPPEAPLQGEPPPPSPAPAVRPTLQPYRPPRPRPMPLASPEERRRTHERRVLHAFDDISLGLASAVAGFSLAFRASNIGDYYSAGFLGMLIAPAVDIGISELLRYTVPAPALAPGLSGGFALGVWLGFVSCAQLDWEALGWLPITTAFAGSIAGGTVAAVLDLPPILVPTATTSGLALGSLVALIASAADSNAWSTFGLIGAGVGTAGGAAFTALVGPPSPGGLMLATGASVLGFGLGSWVSAVGRTHNGLQIGAASGLAAGMGLGGFLAWALRPEPSHDATPTAWQVHPTLLPAMAARAEPTPGLAASLQW